MPDGEVRQVMVTGAAWVGSFNLRAHDYSHVFIGYSQVGRVTLWLDTIAEFKDTLAGEATIGLKDGTEQTLSYGDASGEGNNVLIAARADGGSEVVFLGSVKKVKFLKPARKDKQGNAMFDHWRYSPFTGEKLPED